MHNTLIRMGFVSSLVPLQVFPSCPLSKIVLTTFATGLLVHG